MLRSALRSLRDYAQRGARSSSNFAHDTHRCAVRDVRPPRQLTLFRFEDESSLASWQASRPAFPTHLLPLICAARRFQTASTAASRRRSWSSQQTARRCQWVASCTPLTQPRRRRSRGPARHALYGHPRGRGERRRRAHAAPLRLLRHAHEGALVVSPPSAASPPLLPPLPLPLPPLPPQPQPQPARRAKASWTWRRSTRCSSE